MPYSDDTPRGLWSELQASVVRTSIGRIALAVVLAQAVLSFLYSVTWNIVIPFLANLGNRHSDSVLFERYRDKPMRWDLIFGSLTYLALAVIFVLFVNRWIRIKPAPVEMAEASQQPETEEPQASSRAAGQP